MKPQIERIFQISSGQSVICIIGGDQVPERLNLSKPEQEFVSKQLIANEECIFLNSYNRCVYLVKLKEGVAHYKVREELRRKAYTLRKLIKDNNHPELVITSENAYRGAIEDFTEGLLLSIYSFDKYKTKTGINETKKYPAWIFLQGDLDNSDINWLDNITDAVYFTRDLIKEPVNQLNATTLADEIKKIGETAGFKVEVLTKGKIEALKMGGLLAVNKGSVDPPVFSILEWKPADSINKNPIVLVGKGIVYDTGGLNIKTG